MSANGISTLPSKELKQKAKLDLAASDRAASGNPRSVYDITLLPTQYNGNVIVDNPNLGGLVAGRPWISFSPLLLFANGEQGAWYDPSDFLTMFQDSDGTVPVTAAGQPVGRILDKSKNLTLGSELVTNGNFDSNITGWTAGSASSSISWNNGKLRVSTTALGSVGKSAYQAFPVVAGKTYKILGNVTIINGDFTTVQISLRDGISSETSAVIASSVTMISSGTDVSFIYTATTTTTLYLHCRFFNITQSATVEYDNISAKELLGNHAIQSTTTSRPILQQENGRYYLRFDGVDDFLVTGNINFTATNKLTAFAGVRKLSDASSGVLTELSINSASNPGSFVLLAPSSNGANSYRFFSIGSTAPLTSAGNGVFAAAPDTAVITAIGSISPAVQTLRRNASLVETSTSSQGTGNYGTYPIYIGSRGGTSLPFNGRLYSLIIRGASSTTEEIVDTENFVAERTGITL